MTHNWLLRLLLGGSQPCDSIVCGSKSAQRALLNLLGRVSDDFTSDFGGRIHYRGRVDVIPLCVDTEKFRPADKRLARRVLELPGDAVILLYLGRLSLTDKADVLPLVRVFSELVKSSGGSDLILLLAGAAQGTSVPSVNMPALWA